MSTVYVRNVPDDIYEAIRARARKNRTSITAEVLTVLKQSFPSARELRKRRRIFRQLEKARASAPLRSGPFPSTEQWLRDDRDR